MSRGTVSAGMVLPLRSPREGLGGYVILPRLIDKVRLHALGALPSDYVRNLLKPGLTLDGRFLKFTGLAADALQGAMLSSPTDELVLAWVDQHAAIHSDAEKQAWSERAAALRPDPRVAKFLVASLPDLAASLDITVYTLFDLIDMDEGRLPIPSRPAT